MRSLTSVRELERAVGTRVMADLKSITELDEHCAAFLALSSVGFLGYVDADGRARATAVGGSTGFGDIVTPTRLELPLPDSVEVAAGSPAGLILLIPGVRETLRVNGKLHPDGNGSAQLAVEEAFLHCAKCVLRSRLWKDEPREEAPSVVPAQGPLAAPEITNFLARTPFLLIASRDGAGAADISPKGDPAGFVRILDGTTLAVPDRPGNRRTDTFHNVLEDPEVAVVAVLPGDARTVELTGTARITDDKDLCATMSVKGKAPHAALLVDVSRAALAKQPALIEADPWNPASHPDATSLSIRRAWVDHLKRSKSTGMAAKLVRKAANESVLTAALDLDYRHNLY